MSGKGGHEQLDIDACIEIAAHGLDGKGGAAPSPMILVSMHRELIEQLAPGMIGEAELAARQFKDETDRRLWIAGRVGIHLEAALR